MGEHVSEFVEVPASARLTPAGLLRMELLPVPPQAASFVTTFFRVQCDEKDIRDVQPSSIGFIAVMARGRGTMRFIDGHRDANHALSLFGPSAASSTFEVDGPLDAVGAMLSPVGWAALTGLSAADYGNRIYALPELVDAKLTDAASRVLDEYDELSDGAKVAILADGIAQVAKPLRDSHMVFISTVASWLAKSLSPRLEDLHEAAGVSPRQVQRLCERFFGLPPRSLARKYRALRSAVLLSRPDLTADEINAVQDHFYDQSHMIKEMRLFAGRTPARIADPDTPYLSAFLDLRNFRDSGTRMAPIPRDLRA